VAGVVRAARASDAILDDIRRQIDTGLLPDRALLLSILDPHRKLRDRAQAVVEEELADPTAADDRKQSEFLVASSKALAHLEETLDRFREAVAWSARNSGFNWWLEKRLAEFGRGDLVVVPNPTTSRLFRIDQVSRLHQAFAGARAILGFCDADIAQLANVRLLSLPRLDGTSPRWHPISLGHELAHLRFDEAWVQTWLRTFGNATDGTAGRAARIAENVESGRDKFPPVWYRDLLSWLSESACDAALTYLYGCEGAAALGAYLAVNSVALDSDYHPAPRLRLAVLRSRTPEELSRYAPPDNAEASVTERKSAFLALAIPCREAVHEEMARLFGTSGRRSTAMTRQISRQLAQGFPPDGSVWQRKTVEKKPAEVEAALVRALWRCDALLALRDDPLGPVPAAVEGRVDHAVDFLQFSHRFHTNASKTRTRVKHTPTNRLWVTARGIGNLEDEGKGAPSEDVRLGRHFIVFRRNEITTLSALNPGNGSERIQEAVEVGWGDTFVLHPGEMVLAVTVEQLVVADDCCAQVLSRSSIGRMGLLSATAVHVQPGFRGCLTLELVNLASVPLELIPGQRIAQVVPFPVMGSVRHYTGKYQDQDWRPRFSAANDDWETPVLRVLRERSSGGI